MGINIREINDDILHDRLSFKKEYICYLYTNQNRKHIIKFDELCEKILNSILKKNKYFVQKQLHKFDETISIKDNKTEICPTCSIQEALIYFIKNKK